MIDLVSFSAVSALLSQYAVVLIWFAAGLLFYGGLTDQAVFEDRGQVRVQALGRTDLLIGGLLIVLLGLLVA